MPLKLKYQKVMDAMVKKYGAKKGKQVFRAWANKKGVGEKVDMKAYFVRTDTFDLKALDSDIVEGYFTTGDADIYNDIVTPECMVGMLKQLNERPFTSDIEHQTFSEENETGDASKSSIIPEAKVVSAALDAKGIKVKTQLNKDHTKYTEIKNSLKNGFLNAFSFAYVPVKWATKSIEGVKHRLLQQVELLNLTFTGVPVNPKASFTNVALKAISDVGDTGDELDGIKDDEVDALASAIAGIDLKTILKKAGEKPVAEKDGGKIMTEEEKTEALAEEVKEEASEAKEGAEEKAPEEVKKEAEEEAPAEEAKVEEGKPEAEVPKEEPVVEAKALSEIKEQLKSIQLKQEEFNKVLSSPQFKARSEEMKAELAKKDEEVKSEALAKKGPLDIII